MKLKIYRNSLLSAVIAAIKAVPAKSANPSFTNLHLRLEPAAGESTLWVSGQDGDLHVRSRVPVADSECEAGEALVPAKLFLELLRSLPDIDITLATDGTALRVDWGTGNAGLPLMDLATYPEPKGIEAGETAVHFSAEITEAELYDAIAHVNKDIADDDIRPILNSLYFDFTGEDARIVGTDSKVLAYYTIPGAGSAMKTGFCVPASMVNAAFPLLTRCDDKVIVEADGMRVRLTAGEYSVCATMPSGRFPRYLDVIPKDNNNTLRIDRPAFISSIRRIATGADKAARRVKVILRSSDSLVLEAADTVQRKSAKESVPIVSYSGDDLTIGFNVDSLLRILSDIGSSEVDIRFKGARHAAVIVPVEDSDHVEPFFSLVMPCVI